MQKKGLKKSTKSKSTHLLLKQDERITKIEQQFVKERVWDRRFKHMKKTSFLHHLSSVMDINLHRNQEQ